MQERSCVRGAPAFWRVAPSAKTCLGSTHPAPSILRCLTVIFKIGEIQESCLIEHLWADPGIVLEHLWADLCTAAAVRFVDHHRHDHILRIHIHSRRPDGRVFPPGFARVQTPARRIQTPARHASLRRGAPAATCNISCNFNDCPGRSWGEALKLPLALPVPRSL